MLRLLPVLAFMLVFATQAAAQGLSARSNHVTLLSDAPVDAAALLSDLEALRVAVDTDLGLPPASDPALVRVTILEDPALFDFITPGGATAAAYLQSAAGADIVIAHSTRPGSFLSDALDPDGLRLTLRHEYIHHLLETRYPRKLPVWLNEGLAEHYATFRLDADGQARFGDTMLGQETLPATQDWLPMRAVIEALSDYPDFRAGSPEATEAAQRLYYSQTRALAEFVMDQPNGLARVHHFVDQWRGGRDGEDSFEAAFGLRYGPLEDRMRASLGEDGPAPDMVINMTSGQTAISVRAATETRLDANRLRLLLAHARPGPRLDAQRQSLRQAVSDAEPSPALQRARALAAWRANRFDRADALLDDVLAADPTDAVALKLRAKTAYARLIANQDDMRLWDAAEGATARALAASPDDPDLHLFRVAVGYPIGANLPPATIASLDWLADRQTHLRHPHASLRTIPALLLSGRFAQAQAVLDSAERWQTEPADALAIRGMRAQLAAARR